MSCTDKLNGQLHTSFKPTLALAQVETLGSIWADMAPATALAVWAWKT